MNPIRHIRHIRRIAAALASLAAGLVAFGATPAFARVPIPPDVSAPPAPVPAPAPARTVTHTVVLGGMPGWQIALIAVGAALLAATVAVLTDRARASRRPAVAAAA